jgi:hypothetical protein
MAWRYVAQEALTGELLDLDLPLTREELRWDLSGPGALRGTLPPDYAELRYSSGWPVFGKAREGEWRTYLYAEESGRIRWGGILQRGRYGSLLGIEAAGFTSYPQGMAYQGAYYKRLAADPTGIFAAIWAHLQQQPDGNLGLTVVLPGNCPVRIGTAEEPYELAWWENTDCGSELGDLAQETPFDFTEEHTWSGPSSIAHKVTVAYPRVGRRREDLVFNEDNLREVVELERDGSPGMFANVAYVIGKGEGATTVQGYDGVRDGRLRRMTVYTDKLAATKARANSLARRERLVRSLQPALSGITVNDHDNARIGAWQVGDDIRVEVQTPTLGQVDIWHRITAWSLLTDTSAQLTLARSDSFHYGSVAA